MEALLIIGIILLAGAAVGGQIKLGSAEIPLLKSMFSRILLSLVGFLAFASALFLFTHSEKKPEAGANVPSPAIATTRTPIASPETHKPPHKTRKPSPETREPLSETDESSTANNEPSSKSTQPPFEEEVEQSDANNALPGDRRISVKDYCKNLTNGDAVLLQDSYDGWKCSVPDSSEYWDVSMDDACREQYPEVPNVKSTHSSDRPDSWTCVES